MTSATNEGKLRKVEVMRHEPYQAGKPLVKKLERIGWFHQWITVQEPDGNGSHRTYIYGIVEDLGGEIGFVSPEMLRFPEQP